MCFYISLGIVAGQFIPSPPACLRSTFTFSCTVTGDLSGITIWRVGGSSECILPHTTASISASCGPGSAFTAMSRTGFGTSGPFFSSLLSGIATSTLNGTQVQCFGPGLGRDVRNRVGGSTLQLSGLYGYLLVYSATVRSPNQSSSGG